MRPRTLVLIVAGFLIGWMLGQVWIGGFQAPTELPRTEENIREYRYYRRLIKIGATRDFTEREATIYNVWSKKFEGVYWPEGE